MRKKKRPRPAPVASTPPAWHWLAGAAVQAVIRAAIDAFFR